MKTEQDQITHTVLRMLPYGLYAVGVRGKLNQTNAFIASWVAQCSFEPPLLMIAVQNKSTSRKMLRKSQVFSLNILERSQEDIARILVKPSHGTGAKLGKINYAQQSTGAPVLEEALAFLECSVVSTRSPGDHVIAVAEIVNAGLNREGEVMTCADMGWHYAG